MHSLRRVATIYFSYMAASLTNIQAIEASTSPNVTLFDYRAATWEKLDDLPAALAEGRRMIKAGKTDARVSSFYSFV